MGFAFCAWKVGGKSHPKPVPLSAKMVHSSVNLVEFKQVKRSNTYNAVISILKIKCAHCK